MQGAIRQVAIYFLALSVLCVVLLFFDFRLRGFFTTTMIIWTFLISTILLFGLSQDHRTKLLSGFIAIPIGALTIWSMFFSIALFPIHVLLNPFSPPMLKLEINSHYQIEVREIGFLACGESLIVTESVFGIFEKQIYLDNSPCVTGIYSIETVDFNKKFASFLIFHDGKRVGVKNPHKFQVTFKN